MAVIAIGDARPGMVLTAPVRDGRGRLLMQAGKALTFDYLRALPGYGVTQVEVEEPHAEPAPGVEVAPEAAAPSSTRAVAQPELAAESPTPDLAPTDGEAPWSAEEVRASLEPRLRYVDQDHPVMSRLLSVCVDRLARRARPDHRVREGGAA